MNIFEISDEYLSILDILDETGGELTPEMEEQYKFTKENFEKKVTGYCRIITAINADNDTINNEVERLQSLKKVNENKVKKLKGILLDVVNTFGYNGKSNNKKLDLPLYKLYTRNSEKLEITEGVEIPKEYLKYNISIKELTPTLKEQLTTILKEHKFSNLGEIVPVPDKDTIKSKLEDTTLDLFSEEVNKKKQEEIKIINKFANLIKSTSLTIK